MNTGPDFDLWNLNSADFFIYSLHFANHFGWNWKKKLKTQSSKPPGVKLARADYVTSELLKELMLLGVLYLKLSLISATLEITGPITFKK